MASVAFLTTAAAGLGGAACNSGSLRNGVYRGPETAFQIGPLDTTWRTIAGRGTELAFHHRELGAIIEAHADCRGTDAPLSALTHHLLIGFTERKVLGQETVTLDRREALHTVVRAKLDGVPVTLDLYVVKKNGCTYDLIYSAPPDRYAQGLADFRRFVQGFRVVGEASAK